MCFKCKLQLIGFKSLIKFEQAFKKKHSTLLFCFKVTFLHFILTTFIKITYSTYILQCSWAGDSLGINILHLSL